MGLSPLGRHPALAGSALAIIVAALFAGCKSTQSASSAGSDKAATTQPAAATQPAASARPTKGGAQLWAENCNRCHNARSPSSFSDEQWDVAVHHMRMRVPLTGQEQRAIVEFLKSSN